MAAAPLLLGGAFIGVIGCKAARNFFLQDEKDVKNPEAHNNRMDGVVNRLTANPRLLEQYNEKYIDKKLVDNSVLRRHGSNKQIMRTRSQELQRRASTKAEQDHHGARAEYISEKMAGA